MLNERYSHSGGLHDVGAWQHLRSRWRAIRPGARRLVEAAAEGGVHAAVFVVFVEKAPALHGAEKVVLLLVADGVVQGFLVDRLGEKLGGVAGEVAQDVAIALRGAAEGGGAVQIGVVVHLNERLERNAQGAAVMQYGVVMVGNAPGPGIDVVSWRELACLRIAAQLGQRVATT